jgi:cytochrome c-type biogenesis protein CcmE
VKKRGAAVFLTCAFVLAGGLLWKGLSNATLYFKTVDEAVAERAELGDRRFRLEGIVVPGSVKSTQNGVTFVVTENNADLTVNHVGDPPELFKPNIPVVLEGRFKGQNFASDRILVKHTEEYRKDNPDRVKDYTES